LYLIHWFQIFQDTSTSGRFLIKRKALTGAIITRYNVQLFS
jgi:hypothetical protein